MKLREFALLGMVLAAALLPSTTYAAVHHAAAATTVAMPGIPAIAVQGAGGGQTYTLTIQLLVLMTAITLLPAVLLVMTAFPRIVIVLAILRQAIGAGQAHNVGQVVFGLGVIVAHHTQQTEQQRPIRRQHA